jgi:hypothetical protein
LLPRRVEKPLTHPDWGRAIARVRCQEKLAKPCYR